MKDFMDSMGLGMLAEQVNHIVFVAGIFPLIVPFLQYDEMPVNCRFCLIIYAIVCLLDLF